MFRNAILFALMASGCVARNQDSSVSAVQKVIQLLTDMQATAKKEKHEEDVAFSSFQQFCTDKQRTTKEEIKVGTEKIELMTSEIQKLQVEIADLARELDELQRQLASDEAMKKKQTEQRAKDNSEYLLDSQDLAESVDALERAINVLSKQNYDRKQASEALLQLSKSPKLPEHARRTVAAFLEMTSGDDFLSREAPEANAYEFQSGGIVDMLKKLKDEFRQKKSDCEKEELNSRHAYEMVLQDLTDSIAFANADISSKTVDKEKKAVAAAETSKELGLVTTDRDEDQKFLGDLEVECSEKEESFKEKQDLRTEEIEAIGKAIEILSGASVSGAAETHLSLAQTGSTLVQMKSTNVADNADKGIHKRIVDFLTGESSRLHSKRLDLLAQKLSADPFVKVKKLIEDMITRLLEEANEEAEQKGFCDKELGTNKITRNKLQSEIDELSADIDEGTASIAQLTEDIASLSQEIANLDSAMKEATDMRTAEHTKNQATIKDAVDAQQAIASAKTVLEDFYRKAGGATALVQLASKVQPKVGLLAKGVNMGSEDWDSLANPNFEGTVDKGHKKGMQTFGDTYSGQQDEAGGVLAMLEVIASDFANLETSTKSNEMLSQKAYDDFMNDGKKSVAVKSKNVQMFTNDKISSESKLASDKKDLAVTEDELLAADRYYEKLKPTCVDSGVSFEDRQKARKEEIQSLKEALRILSGEDIA